MSPQHTPEPWVVTFDKHGRASVWKDGDEKPESCRLSIAELHYNHDANANRITSCVNACAGMADPAAEIAALRERINEAMDAVKMWLRFFDEMPKGQFGKIACDIGLMNESFIKSRKVVEGRTV